MLRQIGIPFPGRCISEETGGPVEDLIANMVQPRPQNEPFYC